MFTTASRNSAVAQVRITRERPETGSHTRGAAGRGGADRAAPSPTMRRASCTPMPRVDAHAARARAGASMRGSRHTAARHIHHMHAQVDARNGYTAAPRSSPPDSTTATSALEHTQPARWLRPGEAQQRRAFSPRPPRLSHAHCLRSARVPLSRASTAGGEHAGHGHAHVRHASRTERVVGWMVGGTRRRLTWTSRTAQRCRAPPPPAPRT